MISLTQAVLKDERTKEIQLTQELTERFGYQSMYRSSTILEFSVLDINLLEIHIVTDTSKMCNYAERSELELLFVVYIC